MGMEANADGWRLPDDPTDAAIRDIGDGRYAMRFERFIARPAEKVWAALTTPEQVAQWLGEPVDFDLRAGGRFGFKFPGAGNDLSPAGGVIRAYEPPHLLAFELNGPGGDTVITWALTPERNGCRLVFTQSGLTPWWFFGGMGGWHGMVDDLVAICLDQPMRETEPYRDRCRRYERMWGASVPGFDVAPTLRHHEPDGEVSAAGDGRYQISFLRFYMLPIAKVWAALTEPARLADWLAQVKIDLRLDGEIELRWESHGHVERGVIVALDPPSLLAWSTTDSEGAASEVRWTLHQDDPKTMGTRLVLTQTLIPPKHLLSIATGWHMHLHELPDAAARDAPLAWSLEREQDRSKSEFDKHVARYRAKLPREAAEVPWTG
ncbi:MAG TPA: SRPBCC domain-containing protein [Caulobacteraceae bacterium]